jgi:hypothetical protein
MTTTIFNLSDENENENENENQKEKYGQLRAIQKREAQAKGGRVTRCSGIDG